MKAHTDYLWFETTQRKELVNITRKIEESGLKEDLMDLLERLAPVAGGCDRIAFRDERALEHPPDRRVVVHDQNREH